MSSNAVEAPALVVVTGANGFIAQHCIAALLRAGYRVVGTVRTAGKAEEVLQTHGASGSQLRVVTVADLTNTGAVRAAVGGCSPAGVLHLASPFIYSARDYEGELLGPAVRGARAVLEACAGIASVRRVVQTSSFASVYDATAGPQPGRTYTAADWSPLTYEDGVRAEDAVTAYRAAKTAAERAAVDFVAETKPAFDLVRLCPAMVFGPFLPGARPDDPAALNTSNGLVWAVVGGGGGGGDTLPPTRGPVWVDVRDVALAHVQALRRGDAGGKRFLLAQGVYCNQEVADVARRVVGARHRGRIPVGEPGRREKDSHYGVDASDTERALGIKWRGLEECLADLVPQLFEIEEASRRE